MSTAILEMPSKYVYIDNEEMEYLEGGGAWEVAENFVYAAIGAAVGWMAKTAVSAGTVSFLMGYAGGALVAAVNSIVVAAMINPGLAVVVGTTVVVGVYALGANLGKW